MPPDAGLLIYDGDCGFCTAVARWFDDHSRDAGRVAPWHSLDLDEYGLTQDQVSNASYWVANGRSYGGADGIARALRLCGPVYNVIGLVASKPPVVWLTRAIYPVVVRFRHKLPGATDACRLVSSDQ